MSLWRSAQRLVSDGARRRSQRRRALPGYIRAWLNVEFLETRTVPSIFALGGSNGHVQVRNAGDGSLISDFAPYGANYTGPINVTVGDISGNGFPDVITGAAVGNPQVKVFDGKALAQGSFNAANPDATLLASFFAYGLNFNVGVNLAVGDVEGDGYPDIVTGATVGNPHVKVYSGKDIATGAFNPANPDASLRAQFFAYGLQFNVGVNVAVGDVEGNGDADIVTGATVGNPHVKVYSGKDIATGAFNSANPDVSLRAQFFAYGLQFNVGAHVAVGDVTGDGFDDIITGASLGSPQVKVYSGQAVANGTFNGASPDDSVVTQFFAYDLGQNIGVQVGATDFEGIGRSDVLTAPTQGSPTVRVFQVPTQGGDASKVFETTLSGFPAGLAVGAAPDFLDLLQGAKDFPGPYPDPAMVTYTDPTGQQQQVLAIPGQVEVFFNPSTSQSTAAGVIQADGGSILAQIPRAENYLVGVPAGQEGLFISRAEADSHVAYAAPEVVASLDSASFVFDDLNDPKYSPDDPNAGHGQAVTNELIACRGLGSSPGPDILDEPPVNIITPSGTFAVGAMRFYIRRAANQFPNGLYINLSASGKRTKEQWLDAMRFLVWTVAELPLPARKNLVLTVSAGQEKLDLDQLLDQLRHDPKYQGPNYPDWAGILSDNFLIATADPNLLPTANTTAKKDPDVVIMKNPTSAAGTSFSAPCADGLIQRVAHDTKTSAYLALQAVKLSIAANPTHYLIRDPNSGVPVDAEARASDLQAARNQVPGASERDVVHAAKLAQPADGSRPRIADVVEQLRKLLRPVLAVSPTTPLQFKVTQGQANADPQQLMVQNTGPAGSSLNYTIMVSYTGTPSVPWLQVSGTPTPIPGGTPPRTNTHLVSVINTSSLAVGVYNATVTVTNLATNTSQAVPVTLAVVPVPNPINPYDGLYVGTYQGTINLEGGRTTPVSGSVSFIVANSHDITVLVPAKGGGELDPPAGIFFTAQDHPPPAVPFWNFEGGLTLSGSTASAGGTWMGLSPSAYGWSGSWMATRQ